MQLEQDRICWRCAEDTYVLQWIRGEAGLWDSSTFLLRLGWYISYLLDFSEICSKYIYLIAIYPHKLLLLMSHFQLILIARNIVIPFTFFNSTSFFKTICFVFRIAQNILNKPSLISSTLNFFSNFEMFLLLLLLRKF